jgi:hypothetical protein
VAQSWRSLGVIVDHRIGYGALGDDADHVGGPRSVRAVEDDRGACAAPLEARQHEAQQIDVAADDRALLDEIIHQPLGIVHAFPPKAGTGRDQADDSALMFDNDGAQIVDVFPADALPQRRARRGEDEPPLHDVLRLLDQIEIDVALLRDAVAAVA